MPNSSRPFRVLVVDDDATIADTLASTLTQNGYDAFAVHSAEQALEWCHDNRPDAVITEVVIGSMNGIELAIHLAETVPECEVLLLSGNALTNSLLGDPKVAGYSFPILAKPAHPREILEFLAAIQTDEGT